MQHNWHGIKDIDSDYTSLYYKGIGFHTEDVYDYASDCIKETIDEYKTVSASIEALVKQGDLPKDKYEILGDRFGNIEDPYDIIQNIEDDWINCNIESIKGFLDDLIILKQTPEQFSEMTNETHIYLDKIFETSRCILDDVKETIYHTENEIKRAESIVNETAYIISVQNDSLSVCIDKESLTEKLSHISKLYEPCNAIVINTGGDVICQGVLGDEFIKQTINQIDKKEGDLKYYAQFDDSISVIQDENMTPYGKSVIFSAHEDLAQLFVDKVNKKYDINAETKDVDFFEFYETGKSEDKPLVIASLKDFVSYEDKSYKSFEVELTLAEKDILKGMLQDDISRKIDKEAAAELDRREALLDR